MTTTTLTEFAPNYTKGHAHYHFNLRSSTPTTGSVADGTGLWWVMRSGAVVYESEGLDFGWLTETDGDVVYGKFIDSAGNAGDFASYTITLSASAYSYTQYVRASGNNGSAGTSTGAPVQTFAQAVTNIRANWVNNGEHIIYLMEGETFALGGSIGWNNSSSSKPGRITFKRWGATGGTDNPLVTQTNGTNSIVNEDANHAMSVINIDFDQGYVHGGSAVLGYAVLQRPATGGNGYNLVVYGCNFTNNGAAILVENTSAVYTNRDAGEFDHVAVVDCTFTDQYSLSMGFFVYCRYLLIRNCAMGRIGNSGDNSFRTAANADACIDGVTVSRPSGAYSGNLFRIIGCPGTAATDVAKNITIVDCHIYGDGEGYEIDQETNASRFFEDVQWHRCSAHALGDWAWQINANTGGSLGQDIVRMQFRNCWAKSKSMFSIGSSSNAGGAAARIRSITFRNCTILGDTDGAFFTPTPVLITTSGEAINFIDGSINVIGCGAYCDLTGTGGDSICFYKLPSAAKIGTSNWNYLRKQSGALSWTDSQSLATWQGATVHDDNSVMDTSATHNFVNLGATFGTLDLRCNSTTGPQINIGPSSLGALAKLYVDGDMFVRGASSEIGAFERGETGTPTDPTAGGGGSGSTPTTWDRGLRLRLGLR